MPGRLTDGGGPPLLDVLRYARRGPGRREEFSPAQIEYIARTVRRTPEVMVKVLTQGGQDLKAITRHFAYLGCDGEVEIETDDGRRLKGDGVERALLEDWNLDLEQARPTVDLPPRGTRRSPRLVHKLMFSMPAGTSPPKVLAAVRNFAREEFGAKHRYAMVLHTDEPHPHAHVVVKAMSEAGKRLNIRKATLREWRREFARHLREQGWQPMRPRAPHEARPVFRNWMGSTAPRCEAPRRSIDAGPMTLRWSLRRGLSHRNPARSAY
jgi:hypothetical protein